MHRALAITELLIHILCEVYNDDEGLNLRRGIKDMARVSQVCKTFRDPALDFLWRNLDSLLPLLRLLPLEIHEEHGDKARLSKVLGDLKSSEHQRYISISSRVRTLSFSEPREPIPRNLINDIVKHNLFLTPRVDVLRLRISSEAGLRLLPALITPELTDISLSFDENLYVFDRPLDLGDLIKSVYMTIFRYAPKLVHFSAVDLHEALPLLSLTKAPNQDHLDIACLQSLTHASFYITAASLPQVLNLTSQLCKLEDLTIQACEKPFEEIPRLSSLAPETFSSLKNVTFDGSPDIISRIFSAFPANRAIQSAILRMHGLYTNADIALVLLGLVATASRESLQKIIMTSVLSNTDLAHWDADSGIDTRQFILDIHAIEPALQFQNLEIFSVCLGIPLYLTDEDHLRIAQTWRSVRLLYLSSIVQRVVWTHKPPAGIASLVHYARYCRHLKALGLCLDASTKASIDACIQAVDACENISGTNLSLSSPSIQMIEFGPSWLECNFDPVQINSLAKAFTRLFSNLAACRACRTEELGVPQAAWTWMKVQTLYEYILFTEQGCNVNTPRSAWKLRLFSKWTSDYGKDYEKVALAAPGSSLKADFDDDQNAEAFNQIMYKTARDELARISKEHEVM
ncbi:hypothetical protein DFJ58DRAFT_914054 [Suillus subalutaceus]|uniref:uncharacterized protein n=1 Tax=Suillus subalutaceus TaxID=48586 RepID=UPI001B864C8A|nr:uncharacterized protein DFJ58DRAFT_914054 [Suillus subalutaceus]KAG1854489.1 hypothetical protein DFJ58DRAFT_914054 [Suillus subalutaceus]